ncbi:MAG: glycosyltransferase [Proteobacteria bacterium]|nr:glycosyltransferase [Pseudomonadota bacterium]
MISRLLTLWRGLPVPIRRSAHLAVRAPGAAADAVSAHWRSYLSARERRQAFARAKRVMRRRPSDISGPVTVVGFLGAVHGLGEGARLLLRGLADAGVEVCALDLSERVGFPVDMPVTTPPPGETERGVVISHVNPPELIAWVLQTEAAFLRERRHIGYWAWELEEAPADWIPAFDFVDEVWTPSEFAANAIRRIAPKHIKVSAAPYPIYLNARPPADRGRFGLPKDRVVVFTAFDLRSTAQRKNPRAALAAFQRANRQLGGPALLICKVVGGDLYPEMLAALAAEVADDPSVRLMTDNLTSEEMAVLTASVDIVLSLHRSEGYGLLLAEAIWQGKATIATGWSSNIEFMDESSSALVRFELVPVAGDGPIYRSGRWADADVAHAAEQLAALIADKTLREQWSAATTRNKHVSFDRDAWIRRMGERLPSS